MMHMALRLLDISWAPPPFYKNEKMVGSESVKCAILSTLGASFIGSIISGNAVLKQAMLQSLLIGTKCTPDGFVTKVAE